VSGPITKHRTAIGWLEGVVIFGGALVIVGLVIESGPEIWRAILTWTWPGRGPIGSAIITMGVALEVGLGIFLTLDAKRAEREAKERIALAEKETAEANLARAELGRRFAPRWIGGVTHDELLKMLSRYADKRVDIVLFDVHVGVVTWLGDTLYVIFSNSGWDSRLWEAVGTKMTDVGFTLAYTTDAMVSDRDLPEIAKGVSAILNRGGIPTAISVRSRLPDPVSISPRSGLQQWDQNDVASLRIEIGERSIETTPDLSAAIAKRARDKASG
jgi:hypothetical protein